MKRFAIPELALPMALLFALCACTAAGSGSAPAQTDAPSSAAGPVTGEDTAQASSGEQEVPVGSLHMVWAGSDVPSAAGGQLYETASTYLYDPRCLTAVDLETGVQRMLCTKTGCTHDSPACEAWIC